MKTGSQADLIRELKSEHGISCSRNAISKLVIANDPKIVKTPKNKIKIEETCQLLVANDFGRRTGPHKPKEEPAPETIDPEIEKKFEDNDDGEEGEGIPPLLESNRMIAYQKARKAKVEADILNEKTVMLDEVVETVFKFMRLFRDDIQSISERVAGTARLAKSKHEAEKIVKEETDRILLSRIGNEYSFDDRLKKKIIEILTR